MSSVEIRKTSYAGWNNCIVISNGIAEIIAVADIGPRIIRYGFKGAVNEMCEVKSTLGLTGGDEWRIYGGHRLWHSPESRRRTYEPDNSTVRWKETERGIRMIQDIEPFSRMVKEMEIRLSPDSSVVRIVHRLTNAGPWPVEMSVWSISAMATGGKEVIPLTNRDTGLLPNRILVLWPYSNPADSRVVIGENYVVLKQDPEIKRPFKIGLANENGWAAYYNNDHLFIKYYAHQNYARYPDLGASYETYTNDFMLEMETLSPLTVLEPEAYAEHVETWELFDNVRMPEDDEDEIEESLHDRLNTDFCNCTV